LKEEYFGLPSLMKFGRALFNTVVTSCDWAVRMIVTWSSPAPSVAGVIAAFTFAAVARMKGVYRREAGEPNRLPSRHEEKLSAAAVWKEEKVGPR
jgi:hypothetical protein